MEAPPLTYAGYGLKIEAALALPELNPGEGKRDVVIRKEALGTPPTSFVRDGRYFGRSPDESILVWGDLVAVRVRGGREIGYDRSAAASDYWVRQCLLGPAFGVLLHQRGTPALHASAVEVDGEAVVLLGHKGVGKSTTAAALAMKGHALLADDIVAVDMTSPDAPLVMPGFRHVKLWNDAADAVLDGAGEPLDPELDLVKSAWSMTATRHAEAPVPMGRIYVLDESDELACRELTPVDAFAELIRHSYAPRFIGSVGYTPSHVAAVGTIARHVPVFRLQRKTSLQRLPDLVKMIERHRYETAKAPTY